MKLKDPSKIYHKLFFNVLPMALILVALRGLYNQPALVLPVEDQWLFCVGTQNESLHHHIPLDQLVFDKVVNIPHSIPLPNTALWYQKEIRLNRDTIWQIKADDGAQLWFDGKSIPALGCNYFYLKGRPGSHTVTIRVLNNAVNGGLKKIAGLDVKEVNTIKKLKDPLQLERYPGMRERTNAHTFQTRDKNTLRFTAWGDSQGGWDTFQVLTKCIGKKQNDFTLGLGDLTATGCDVADWHQLCTGLQQLPADQQIFLIPGNHDYDGYYDHLVASHFMEFQKQHSHPKSYFSFGNEMVVFMVLDPNINFPLALDGAQLQWANKIMNSNEWKNAHWRFVLCHQVAYGSGWPGYNGESFLRSFFDQNAEKYKIDFVLSGHIHDYERLQHKYGSQTTHFLVSGGAGGSLEPEENDTRFVMEKIIKKHHYLEFEVNKQQVQVRTLDLKNNILDSLYIEKK